MQKKMSWGIMFAVSAVLLTGCGTSGKEDAVKFLENQNNPEVFNVIHEEGQVKSLDFELNTDIYYRSYKYVENFLSEMEAASWSTTEKYDRENEIEYHEFDNSFNNSSWIAQYLYFEENSYQKLMPENDIDEFFGILFGSEGGTSENPEAKTYIKTATRGKYLYTSKEETADSDSSEETVEDKSRFSYIQTFGEFNETLDEESFTKKGGLITRTYTKKEILQYFEMLEDKEESFSVIFQFAPAFIDLEIDIEDRDLDFTVDVVIDPKNYELTATINLAVDNNVVEGESVIEFVWTSSKEQVSLELPDEKDVLTNEEYEAIKEKANNL
ncbi:hypothetical protein M2139_001023 [Enterococcus sp. PF1-24]|uniref:hypothetical protein n=1 Tax=unclassified Enterococcus TaxID=2608891 RepID=UPI002473DDF7|nr:MULTISPECIES: hypothetical protein [unclassified Enterococcus]MDH6364038.1 hypothetical protein [Enterococcus sp. PFB1-1]MDH6401139.1 hypothetical protein [Enterococcus sp. PF1-24]